jgi:hypothetical protein
VEPKNGSVKAIEPLVGGFASPGLQSIPLGDIAPGILQVHAKVGAADGKLVVSVTTRAQSGGSQSPLGGDATPFAPVALVKFGKPITWTVSRGDATHDADAKTDMTTGTRPTATFAIPAGTTDVFVQIANKGDSDGAYDNVTLDLSAATLDAPPDDDVPELTAQPETKTKTETTSGCACSTVGGGRGTRAPRGAATHTLAGGLFAALGLAAAVARRRRR